MFAASRASQRKLTRLISARRSANTSQAMQTATASLSTRTACQGATKVTLGACADSVRSSALSCRPCSRLTRPLSACAGTYGTNIELSAFANLYQRSIKVMQPGLTYIITPEEIEGVVSPDAELTAAGMNEEEPLQENLTPRELRLRKRLAKTKEIKGKMKAKQAPKPKRAAGSLYIVCVASVTYAAV